MDNELCPNDGVNAIPDESCNVMEAKSHNTTPLPSPSTSDERRLSIPLLPPVTPDSTRETSGEQHLRLSNLLTPLSSRSDAPISLKETPKDSIFDSFAPGPDKLMLAPYCDKHMEKSQVHLVRRCLSFELDSDLIGEVGNDDNCNSEMNDAAEEKSLFDLVYAAVLGAIVSEGNERLFPNSTTRVVSDSDGFKTPDFLPKISAVAEICPGAPVKAMLNRRRHIDKGLCRKLEF